MPPTPPSPGERFNFAAHLLEANAGWPERTAFIDDTGMLSYGELAVAVRRLAAALRAQGLKREERVLLLMHDGNDWPVAFLGAMHAGLVPVAVNTLLTADDYAYMLEHSRAQAVLVSGALLPALWGALFIDAGRAVADWRDYKPAWGYGAGLRWRSPIGPLQIDVAYGLEPKKLRLHMSVGFVF